MAIRNPNLTEAELAKATAEGDPDLQPVITAPGVVAIPEPSYLNRLPAQVDTRPRPPAPKVIPKDQLSSYGVRIGDQVPLNIANKLAMEYDNMHRENVDEQVASIVGPLKSHLLAGGVRQSHRVQKDLSPNPNRFVPRTK